MLIQAHVSGYLGTRSITYIRTPAGKKTCSLLWWLLKFIILLQTMPHALS